MSGQLIVIEGIDGSGKGTQAALLHQRLNAAGVRTALLSFPRYQQTAFGGQIGRFLNGEFGSLDQVHPLLASLLFAGDRLESRALIHESLARHDVVLCDRYVASNIAHQAAKRTGEERRQLIEWIEQLEYGIYQLPRPQLTIWLDLPVSQAQTLIARKAQRTYTEKPADLQEADGAYLECVSEVYAALAERDSHWRRITCLTQVSRDAESSERSASSSIERAPLRKPSASRLTDEILRDVADIATEIFQLVHAAVNISPSAIRPPPSAISSFADLVTSRKSWLNEFLQPWCKSAARKDLLLAEQEWTDIAGKVDPEATLWRWAWSRFPGLVHESLGIEETTEIEVRLKNGQVLRGFPDARKSLRGQLVILSADASGRFQDSPPFSLDEIDRIDRPGTIDPAAHGVP